MKNNILIIFFITIFLLIIFKNMLSLFSSFPILNKTMNSNYNSYELFNECMKNNPEKKRKYFSKKITSDAQSILSCLDQKEIPYKIVGSVAREIAHQGSDLDIHVDVKYKSKALQCARFTKKKSLNDTCGLFEQFNTQTKNNIKVDMTFKKCIGAYESKWNLFPYLDEDIKNIMFCTNEVLRRDDLKMATHYDYYLYPSLTFTGVHAKRKLYTNTSK